MMSWQCRWIDGVIIDGENPQSTQTISVSLHGCEHLAVLCTWPPFLAPNPCGRVFTARGILDKDVCGVGMLLPTWVVCYSCIEELERPLCDQREALRPQLDTSPHNSMDVGFMHPES